MTTWTNSNSIDVQPFHHFYAISSRELCHLDFAWNLCCHDVFQEGESLDLNTLWTFSYVSIGSEPTKFYPSLTCQSTPSPPCGVFLDTRSRKGIHHIPPRICNSPGPYAVSAIWRFDLVFLEMSEPSISITLIRKCRILTFSRSPVFFLLFFCFLIFHVYVQPFGLWPTGVTLL